MIIVVIKPTDECMTLNDLDLNISVVDMRLNPEPITNLLPTVCYAVTSHRSQAYTEAVLRDCGYAIVSVMTRIGTDAPRDEATP